MLDVGLGGDAAVRTPITSPADQLEINAILWRACDTFRVTVDPSEHKNYLLTMLFVKYVSDTCQNHYDEL